MEAAAAGTSSTSSKEACVIQLTTARASQAIPLPPIIPDAEAVAIRVLKIADPAAVTRDVIRAPPPALPLSNPAANRSVHLSSSAAAHRPVADRVIADFVDFEPSEGSIGFSAFARFLCLNDISAITQREEFYAIILYHIECAIKYVSSK